MFEVIEGELREALKRPADCPWPAEPCQHCYIGQRASLPAPCGSNFGAGAPLHAVVLAAVVTVSVQRRARFFLVSGVRQEQQRSCAQTHAERVYSAQKRGQALPLTGVPRVRPQFVNGRAQVASPVRARSPGQPPCRLHNLIIVHDCIKSSTRDAVIAADGPHQVPAALPGR